MNKRQVIVLWIIALILVVSLAIVNSTKSEGYESATDRSRGETLLADFDPNEVSRLTIQRDGKGVTLQKGETGWVVVERDNYPADASAIYDLLRTVTEVEVTQGIEAETEFLPRFGMDSSASDETEQGLDLLMANDAGTELAQLTFGKNLEAATNPMSPFGGGSTGRFVRNHADSSGVYVTSELFPTLDPDPANWLNDEFLKVERIEKIAVSQPGKMDEFAWKLSREDENAQFSLEGKKANEELDESALNPLKNLFSYARFDDVVPASENETAWDKGQRQQAIIETFEGVTYNVTFGPEKPSEGDDASSTNYLMRVTVTADIPKERKAEEGETEEDAKTRQAAFEERKKALETKLELAKTIEGRTFRVTKFTVDPLLKDRTGLIKSAPPAGGPTTGGPGVSPATGPVPGIRPGTGPGMGPPRRPTQAVTPPIAIPPRPVTPTPEPTPEPETAPDEESPAERPETTPESGTDQPVDGVDAEN